MSTQFRTTTRDLDKHKFRGLADHGNHLLNCSACGAPLLNLLLVDPEVPVTLKYRVDCPHCGDHSFPKELTGQVCVGASDYTVYDGHRDPHPGEPDDIIYLKTSKAKVYQ